MNRQAMATLTANNQLAPGELAFEYGNGLKLLNPNAASVQIKTQSDASGVITSAQLVITYNIKPDNLKSHTSQNTPIVQGGYQINYNEVGFPANSELFDPSALSNDLNVSFNDDSGYLNVKLPIKNYLKRDNAD